MSDYCGTCEVCCRLYSVPSLNKKEYDHCPHCVISKKGSCSIYSKQPKECRNFECAWLKWKKEGQPVEELLKPENSHVMLTSNAQGVVTAHVDPDFPDAWKEEKVLHFLQTLAQNYIIIIKIKDVCYQIIKEQIIQLPPGSVSNGNIRYIKNIIKPTVLKIKEPETGSSLSINT